MFQKLWDRDRGNRDFEFGVAAIALQMKDWATAEALFQDLKRAGYGENGIVELYLAQIAEETERYEEAIDRYLRGARGRARVARETPRRRDVGQAEPCGRGAALSRRPARRDDRTAHAGAPGRGALLRDASDNAAAYAVLKQALIEHPDSPDLLYDAAMVAEKLDKIDEAEASLRRVVELKPDDAQALNALGYTLVDRTPRTSEGFALIEKAHKLSPDDPFILDSMGWAFYRLGKLDDAEAYLSRAMTQRPDAEIAAHLGEVLWKKGDLERAREVWQAQLKPTPTTRCCRRPCAGTRRDPAFVALTAWPVELHASFARRSRDGRAVARVGVRDPAAVRPHHLTRSRSTGRSPSRDACPRGAAAMELAANFTWTHERRAIASTSLLRLDR